LRFITLSTPACRFCDFCPIFVPFGNYDEPEILPYAIRLVCSTDLVADTTPLGTQLGNEAFIGKVVDQHGSTLREELEIAQGDRSEQTHINDTSWDGGCSRKIGVRSSVGRRFDGAPLKSDKTVSRGAVLFAGRASGRHCCTGLTAAARSERSSRVDDVVVLLTNSLT
jgi:hypothetical protein